MCVCVCVCVCHSLPQCTEQSDGSFWLTAEPSLECFQASWWTLAAGAAMSLTFNAICERFIITGFFSKMQTS